MAWLLLISFPFEVVTRIPEHLELFGCASAGNGERTD
jgi:hypothetical protein